MWNPKVSKAVVQIVVRPVKISLMAFGMTFCLIPCSIALGEEAIDDGMVVDPDALTDQDLIDLLNELQDLVDEAQDDIDQDICDAYAEVWEESGEEAAEDVWDYLQEDYADERQELQELEDDIQDALDDLQEPELV